MQTKMDKLSRDKTIDNAVRILRKPPPPHNQKRHILIQAHVPALISRLCAENRFGFRKADKNITQNFLPRLLCAQNKHAALRFSCPHRIAQTFGEWRN